MTATRVAGNEPLKIITPTSPFIQPLAVLFIPMLLKFSVSAFSGIAPLALPETVEYGCEEL
ncbi:hypothetical protein I6F15_26885 [Bradyrhizobium sp. BRP14]|nr:hypothetical protein [Bradyrhizobium sp. BRP14]